jgi:predicted glycoside hydrolase/deacetylase ChbG (UPF0249 family)
MKRVVLCVDDFGLNLEVNQAVLNLVDAGVVSATSCMSQAPAWGEGAAHLKGERRSRLDVGLHLNLTEPFAAAPDAALPLGAVIARALVRALNPQWLQRAVCSQLDAFEAVWGDAPDYVDGHQHVHQLPQVRECLLDELDRRYGKRTLRPWLRLTRARRGPGGVDLKQRVIENLGAGSFERLSRQAGYTLNGALLGVYGFDADAAAYTRRLQHWLAQAQDGDVLMMHPACPAALGEPLNSQPNAGPEDPIAEARRIEYRVLTERGASLLTQAGVQPARLERAPVF